MFIQQSFSFTRIIKQQFISLGAEITSGDVSICVLKTNESKEFFLQKVLNLPEEQDPILQPTFGYSDGVTAQVQNEVFAIVSTYQGLMAHDFAPPGPVIPIVPVAKMPPAMMWHFHHAQMAIVESIRRLANPGPGPHTNTINGLPLGAFICDLCVIYANVIFIVHILRADT
jgi:hypothetical protein